MSVLRQQENHFSSSIHGIQSISNADEPIATYLSQLNEDSKRNTFKGTIITGYNHSTTTVQKRKSVGGVIDKLISKMHKKLVQCV